MRLLLLLLLAIALPVPGFGHEGESHDDGTAGQAPAVNIGAPLPVSKESQFLLGIRTDLVRKQRLSQILSALGKVHPRPQDQAVIASSYSGRVTASGARPIPRIGETVQAGETLAQVQQVLQAPERVDLATKRAVSEAAVKQARAELTLVQRELERQRELRQIIAVKQIQESEAKVQVADANLGKALEELKVYEQAGQAGNPQWKSVPLTAAISGVIVEVHAVPGEIVEANRTLFRILNLATAWVSARIFEADLPKLEKPGQGVVTSPVYPELPMPARLLTLGSEVSEQTRTVEAIFEVANLQGKLRAGMFVEVSIDTGLPVQVLAIPSAALEELGGQKVVFVHSQPEEFAVRPVDPGLRSGDFTEVHSGLAPGDRVVTTGQYQLRSMAMRGRLALPSEAPAAPTTASTAVSPSVTGTR